MNTNGQEPKEIIEEGERIIEITRHEPKDIADKIASLSMDAQEAIDQALNHAGMQGLEKVLQNPEVFFDVPSPEREKLSSLIGSDMKYCTDKEAMKVIAQEIVGIMES